ncbi:MAG: hypothetical protein CR971_00625 [candidate division SR1 bacterium]|nr:MAG: hypothetical protein CR971_00625 [candidate division SR1 bacterium]
MTYTKEQLMQEGRKYGRDIPHLVDEQDYDLLFDPDAIESMQGMYDATYESIDAMDIGDIQKGYLKSNTKTFIEKERAGILSEEEISRVKNWMKVIDNKKILTVPQPIPQPKTKKKAINIRIHEEDILLLKSQADEIGLPYQTMLSSFLHQLAHRKINLSAE